MFIYVILLGQKYLLFEKSWFVFSVIIEHLLGFSHKSNPLFLASKSITQYLLSTKLLCLYLSLSLLSTFSGYFAFFENFYMINKLLNIVDKWVAVFSFLYCPTLFFLPTFQNRKWSVLLKYLILTAYLSQLNVT